MKLLIHFALLLFCVICSHTLIITHKADEDRRIIHSSQDGGFNEELTTQPVAYGYPTGDVTHGVGYGHHLHPFYYQGKLLKFYNCALEDEWKPFAMDPQSSKLQKKSPLKKYSSNYEKSKFQHTEKEQQFNDEVNRRKDYSINQEDELKHEHSKLVQDINALSESQSFNKKSRFQIDNEIPIEQRIRLTEPTNEYIVLEDILFPSPTNTEGYKVNEPVVDLPPSMQMNQPRPQTNPQKHLPFQHYKKFKVVSIKPTSIVRIKYSGIPYKAPVAIQPIDKAKKNEHPYAFVNPMTNPTGNDQKNRRGRNMPMGAVKPQLTLLEQFLLLFPKLIK